MTLKFHGIFTACAGWTIESEDKRFVKELAGGGIAQLSNRGGAGSRQGAGDPLAGLVRPRAANPNDRDGGGWTAAGQGEDRVTLAHGITRQVTSVATWCQPSQIIFTAT